MKSPSIPAGLLNRNVELFVQDDELYAVYKGKTYPYLELPETIRNVFQVELIRDKKAQESLKNDMAITDSTEMELQFVKCRYGGFDNNPDLAANGETRPECWDCGVHGSCDAEGKVCHLPAGAHGTLTKREYQIAVLVGRGCYDYEISDQLDIAESTVREYLKRIRSKIGANNRQEITMFAHKNGLL